MNSKYEKLIWKLFHKHQPNLAGYDPEDWFQIAYVAIVRALETYDSDKGTLYSYLSKAVWWQWQREFRKATSKSKIPESFVDNLDSAEEILDSTDVEKEVTHQLIITDIRRSLNDKENSCLDYFIGLKTKNTIADQHSVTTQTVTYWCNDLKEKLKETLGGYM